MTIKIGAKNNDSDMFTLTFNTEAEMEKYLSENGWVKNPWHDPKKESPEVSSAYLPYEKLLILTIDGEIDIAYYNKHNKEYWNDYDSKIRVSDIVKWMYYPTKDRL